jgi:syntaxin 16
MRQNLINKLSDFTKKLKINEEEYLKKFKEIVGEDKSNLNIDSTNFDDLKKGNNKNNVQQEVYVNKENSLRLRNEEINNLLNSINELASIFKDFQTLVLEQGTILDRIDYNIIKASENISDAHTNLEKANKNLEKNCARNTNLTLMSIIFIFAILLILKYIK